jgi:glycerol uptake facilitator-like aquaporin
LAQVAAAFAALKVYEMLVDNKLTSSSGTFDWRIFVAEALGAVIFGAAFAAVVTQKIEGYQAAYAIGAGLFLGIVVASLVSVGVVNPAVAVGLKLTDVNYIFGPVVGALVGFGLVAFVINPVVTSSKVIATSTTKIETDKVVAKKVTTVSYTYSRGKWSGHNLDLPISKIGYYTGILYMYPKYTLRYLFFRRAGRKLDRGLKIKAVRNPKKTHKLHHIATSYKIDENKFQQLCQKQLKYWLLIP